MATADVLAPHDVSTSLNYYAPNGEAPFAYVQDPPEGKPKCNIEHETYPVIIHDVRGKEDTVGLDKTGFQFVQHASAETEFVDEERIRSVYYKEVEELLKRETGAKRVFIFDHTIRRDYDDTPDKPGKSIRGPAQQAHVDQTFDAAIARVHHHLGADAERLLKGRVRIINVWRPIAHPVAHFPLAVADWRTLNVEQDLVPVSLIYPNYNGSTFAVKHSPKLKWHFLSNQRPDEVTLIKCFDSDVDKARLSPHSAFADTSSPASAPKRQSIEVRTLVFDLE